MPHLFSDQLASYLAICSPASFTIGSFPISADVSCLSSQSGRVSRELFHISANASHVLRENIHAVCFEVDS